MAVSSHPGHPGRLLETTTITSLLSAADWAGEHAEPDTLREVARILAPCLAAPEQIELQEIARLAQTDLMTAIGRWLLLSQQLKVQLADPATGEWPSA